MIVLSIDVGKVDTALDSSGSFLTELVVVIEARVSVSFVDFSGLSSMGSAMLTAINIAKTLAIAARIQIACLLKQFSAETEP